MVQQLGSYPINFNRIGTQPVVIYHPKVYIVHTLKFKWCREMEQGKFLQSYNLIVKKNNIANFLFLVLKFIQTKKHGLRVYPMPRAI